MCEGCGVSVGVDGWAEGDSVRVFDSSLGRMSVLSRESLLHLCEQISLMKIIVYIYMQGITS